MISEEMQNNSELSKIAVFRYFSVKLSRLKKQLDLHYQHGLLLWDQLIIAVDHKNFQQSLLEKIQKSSQDDRNRNFDILVRRTEICQ